MAIWTMVTAGVPQQGIGCHQDFTSWQLGLERLSPLLSFAAPVPESLLPDHPGEGGSRAAEAPAAGGVQVASTAHRAPGRQGPRHRLLGLCVSGLHSCHPQLECLEAPDYLVTFHLDGGLPCLDALTLHRTYPKGPCWPITWKPLHSSSFSKTRPQEHRASWPQTTPPCTPGLYTAPWAPNPRPRDRTAS